MGTASTKSREQVFADVLFHGLRVTDAELNESAASVLGQLGAGPVARLVRVAARRKNAVPHRLRALAVIERIGLLSGPNDWLDLSILAADPNERIRAAAGRCLVCCPIAVAAVPDDAGPGG